MSAVPGAARSVFRPDDSLQEEQQAARSLLDLLNQEQAILIGADIDSLPLITEQKAPIVSQMLELANRRHRALANAGHTPNETGMQAWIDTRIDGKPAYPTALSTWTQLLAMARQAQEINRINGLLINTHMARNQSALNTLRVQTGNGGGNFYGPDGQATSRGRGRGLVVG